mgnify:FL=1
MAYRLASVSPFITASTFEATEFPDLAARYQVTGVPKTIIDDRIEIVGNLPEAEFVRKALEVKS